MDDGGCLRSSPGFDRPDSDRRVRPHSADQLVVRCVVFPERGRNWTRCNLSGSSSGWCYALAVAPSATNTIYAGGQVSAPAAVYRSTDYGSTWTRPLLSRLTRSCHLRSTRPTQPRSLPAHRMARS